MARMYPNRLRVETKSNAERLLYERFQRELPDEYTVFHSVAWLARDTRGGARDGEADFIVAHPERGILIVEVKGGNIRYDGASDQWYSNQHEITDPFEQAKDNKYSLLEKLKELPYWRHRWVTLGHVVAFPDVPVKQDLRLDAPETIILDCDDLDRLPAWVEGALAYWQAEDGRAGEPGRDGVRELVALLSPSWELRAPLAVQFAREEQDFIRLTEQQFRLLDFLNFQRRAAISGCAGSGKTTMATEQARRLGAQGFRVLLTCFNRHLAEYLQSDGTLPAKVEVRHFHGVCARLVREAGMADRLAGGWQSQEWYDRTLPELLMEAAERLGPQYDAIIVDEGQDFLADWWVPLQCLLEDPDRGIFYIFYDDNQNLFQTAFSLPPGLLRFPLTHNCRNTQHIHRTFMPFSRSEVTPQVIGPEGRPAEVTYYGSEHALKQALRRALHRLCVEEEVDTEDIVVLTPRARDKSLLRRWGFVGNFRLTDRWPPGSNEVYCTTPYLFKGLESPVVILVEVYPSSNQDLETLLYVGCSRARNHLIVLAEDGLPEDIRVRLPAIA